MANWLLLLTLLILHVCSGDVDMALLMGLVRRFYGEEQRIRDLEGCELDWHVSCLGLNIIPARGG